MKQARLRWAAAALSLACAALALLFASTSSPLYATNFWTDTNIYFTIGRGMTQGLAPYRDLFDHKGPLLYLLYALGALISRGTFGGVFLLETVSLAATLYLGWRIACLWGEGPLTLAAIAPLAVATAACAAFNQGGSAEEFCLPALTLGLLVALLRLRGDGRAARLDAAFGAAAGWVFSVKFTGCGLFFGLGLALLGHALRARGLAQAVRMLLRMAAGFLLFPLLCAAYLLAAGALGACADVYFIQNLFEYGGAPMSAAGHIYNALAYLRTQSASNPAVAAAAIAGCMLAAGGALARGGRGRLFAALAAPLGAGFLLLLVYWGETAHPYYALVFAALAPLAFLPLGALAARVRGVRAALAPALALTLFVAPACRALCAAVPLLDVRREDMPQTSFAQIMREADAPTLLDLTSLDQGFYLAADITPTCRYFADNNLNTAEKTEAIAGYLARGATRFVVTRGRDPGPRYVKIAEASGPFDLNDMRAYTLYERVEDAADGNPSDHGA